MKKIKIFSADKKGMTKRPPRGGESAGLGWQGKAQACFARRTLYRMSVVNIQKIQNGNSEFFVNSLRDFRC